MKLMSFGLCFVALELLGWSPVLAQGQLWIVDKAGGGSAFTEIQPAIDAAADGDTILVKPGSYGAFTIDDKALVVTRSLDSALSVTSGTATVQNLAATRSITIRGINASKAILQQNAGAIWLESIVVGGFPCASSAVPGTYLSVDSCAVVIATRCGFFGGEGSPGGHGVDASTSNVYLFESNVFGGKGENGAAGGDGVHLTSSFLFASGAILWGGCGGDLDEHPCAVGGAGGSGLVSSGGPVPALLETTLQGGWGGTGFEGPWCGAGPDGPPAVGSYDLIAGYARDYQLTSPVPGGQTTTLSYTGKPGDVVFTLIGLLPSALFLPDLAGTLVVPIPPLLVSHGQADAAGKLTTMITLPILPPGIEAFPVYAQAAAVSAVGTAVLGAPSQLTIL